MHQVVAAVFRRGAGNVLRVLDRPERPQHEVEDLPRLAVPLENEVEPRKAPHGTPIDDLILPVGVVSQVGCNNVLERVHCRYVDSGFGVWSRNPHVVGGDPLIAQGVHPAREDPRDNLGVIDGKTCDQVHIRISSSERRGVRLRES